jgi:hypothetical protein
MADNLVALTESLKVVQMVVQTGDLMVVLREWMLVEPRVGRKGEWRVVALVVALADNLVYPLVASMGNKLVVLSAAQSVVPMVAWKAHSLAAQMVVWLVHNSVDL